jgi:hypothetical protein
MGQIIMGSGRASRRSVLKAIAAAPIFARLAGPPPAEKLALLCDPLLSNIDLPSGLSRSSEGRNASRFRYHNAESFFLGVEQGIVRDASDRLYQIGIVLQLGLSSHLLDVGFTDRWCARNIGLRVSRSLALSNATGLGFQTPDFDLLATILSPYSRWRLPDKNARIDDVPFTPPQLLAQTRALLDHVHRATGHPRPRGWHARHG